MRPALSLALVTTIGLFTARSAAATPIVWSGNGHSYEAISVPAGIDWRAAYDSCQARGGYLATLTSAEEHAFAYGLVSGRPELWYIDVANNGIGPWLGGFQPPGSGEPGGGWRWVSDEPWSYTAWSPGEPNNTGAGEDRLVFFKLGGLIGDRWNDLMGAEHVKGFVLEIPTPAVECSTSTLNGHTYKLVRTPDRISWPDARDAAIAMGGHLATISSASENLEVASLAAPDPTLWCIDPAGNGQGPWIGGYQPAASPEPAGGWSWVTGEGFGFTAWATGEPNNLNGTEHYLQLFSQGSLTGSQWNDMNEFTPYGGLGYIVEFDDGRACATTGVEGQGLESVWLLPAYPNPTRARTSFALQMAVAAPVRAFLYDARGRIVRRLENGRRLGAGAHVIAWDGTDERGAAVASGLYRMEIRAGEVTYGGSVVVLR